MVSGWRRHSGEERRGIRAAGSKQQAWRITQGNRNSITLMSKIAIIDNYDSFTYNLSHLVKELGAKKVISLASRDIHKKFLYRNGADYVIYPDYDIAERMARKYSKENIIDYMAIDSEYGIYEIKPFDDCIGKTVRDVNFRAKYHCNIIGYKKEGGK